ncbi:hypothetical protein [Leptothoe spongobia]|nr:hypothetical protein [Leptothoe spongobia]
MQASSYSRAGKKDHDVADPLVNNGKTLAYDGSKGSLAQARGFSDDAFF